jgi:hypothetical protein
MTQAVLENIGPHEAEIIKGIVDRTIAKQEKLHKPGTLARRDLHSKSHGTVKARLRIFGGTGSGAAGLFAVSQTYDALVRLSNGTAGVGADFSPNVRGFAIKALGVPGLKLLPEVESSTEHDFLLANHPTFFAGDLPTFDQITRLVDAGKMGQVFKSHPREAFKLFAALLKLVKNPLQIEYHSQVAYLCGEGKAVKYALMPHSRASFFSFPNLFDRDYLRHGVESLLKKQEAKFTFCVRFQQDPVTEPVEDPTVPWRGPLVPVGELTIPQTDAVILESDGEALLLHPWHALPEHRPLGWPGRVRKDVYTADFNWRRQKNEQKA